MTEDAPYFTDGAAYERFMGRWSRAIGELFLDWITPPRSERRLDIGCGTGVFTELVLDTCAPAIWSWVDGGPSVPRRLERIQDAHRRPRSTAPQPPAAR